MGYTTDFWGQIKVEPPLNDVEVAYLNKFSDTRRMKRRKGPYYVDNAGFAGQDHEDDILDYNQPPDGQPGLWCQWIPTSNTQEGWIADAAEQAGFGQAIVWNGAEKFYYAPEWMEYIINHFLREGAHAQGQEGFKHFQFNHVLNGVIDAQGEDPEDRWRLVVENNRVRVERAEVTWPEGEVDTYA